ncbi:hypothetical protein WH7805_08331 [Synechococcus sp. WH 7805]|nr:hypothetical protein WH7805_08331 [Synechococcus sp. WH 7805]
MLKAAGALNARAKEKMKALQTVAEMEQQLKAFDEETNDARKEAELTLIHLHQVQVELGQAFLGDQTRQE